MILSYSTNELMTITFRIFLILTLKRENGANVNGRARHLRKKGYLRFSGK